MMTHTRYMRKQPGIAMMFLILLLLAVVAGISIGRPLPTATFISSFVLLAVGVVFSTMTIAVTDDSVQWWFTFGVLRQKIGLDEIQVATSGNVSIINGLGIRTNGKDWLWIVNGSTVLRLELRSGRNISLGSPEPEDVAILINRLISGS